MSSTTMMSLCIQRLARQVPLRGQILISRKLAQRRFASSSNMELTVPAPDCLAKPLKINSNITLLGPGPSNGYPAVLEAGSLPILGHMHSDFLQIMDEVKAGLQYAFQTRNEWTLAVSGTGHAAMECCIFNLLEAGDKALVLVNGLWGGRVASLAERIGTKVVKLQKSYGEVFSLDEIEEGIKTHKPQVLFLCHGESSSGTCQSIEGVGDICQRHNCLLIVDAVASLGAVSLNIDDLNIDAAYSGAQKCLSAPPGASPVSFGPRARAKVLSRETKSPSFYFDMIELANYWGCDGTPRRYHHTAQIVSVYQLREALRVLTEEGLENCRKRHQTSSALLKKELENNGFELYVKDSSIRLPTVTLVKVPAGIDAKQVSVWAMKTYNMEIAGGLGESAGKVWRIGLMGNNCTPENVHKVVQVLNEGVKHFRKKSKL